MVSVLLDECDDCGTETQQRGCFPALAQPELAHDDFSVELLFDDEVPAYYPYEYFDFECVVIGQSGDLDSWGNERVPADAGRLLRALTQTQGSRAVLEQSSATLASATDSWGW